MIVMQQKLYFGCQICSKQCYYSALLYAAAQIGFGEVDYRNSERDNGVTVVVTKQGANVGDLTVTVTPLPLSPPPVPIPNDLQSDALLNDPAECKSWQ